MWALRPFRGILGTLKGTHRVYSRCLKNSRAKGPYQGPKVATSDHRFEVRLQVIPSPPMLNNSHHPITCQMFSKYHSTPEHRKRGGCNTGVGGVELYGRCEAKS